MHYIVHAINLIGNIYTYKADSIHILLDKVRLNTYIVY
jgi:hypothetical protein